MTIEENEKLTEQFPVKNGLYPDHITYNENDGSFTWIYFNPDGNNGNGDFEEISISGEDIKNAYAAMSEAEDNDKRDVFIDYIFENCKTGGIDSDTELFTAYANDYITPSDDVTVYYGIGVLSSFTEDIDKFIEQLTEKHVTQEKESHFAYMIEQNGEIRFYQNDNLNLDKLQDIARNSTALYKDLMSKGTQISEAEFAEIEQNGGTGVEINIDENNVVVVSESEIKNYSLDSFKTNNEAITLKDIEILRTIEPRKSVLNFTEKERELTKNWAKRFDADIGKKSPYYRAENEWRDKDDTLVPIIEMKGRNNDFKETREDIKSQIIPRGIIKNKDTLWDIQISRKGLEDTVSYAVLHKDILTLKMLYCIDDVISKGIYLDTNISELNNNNKSPNTAFMHKMYLPVVDNNKSYIAKITIEELFDGQNDTLKRMYNLQDIKIEPLRHVSFIEQSQPHLKVLNGSNTSIPKSTGNVKSFDEISDIKIEPLKTIGLANKQLRPAIFNDSEVSISESTGNVKSFDEISDIKIEPLRRAAFTYERLALSVLNDSEISIADLFSIVKSFDKDFYLNKRENNNRHIFYSNKGTPEKENQIRKDLFEYMGEKRKKEYGIKDVSDIPQSLVDKEFARSCRNKWEYIIGEMSRHTDKLMTCCEKEGKCFYGISDFNLFIQNSGFNIEQDYITIYENNSGNLCVSAENKLSGDNHIYEMKNVTEIGMRYIEDVEIFEGMKRVFESEILSEPIHIKDKISGTEKATLSAEHKTEFTVASVVIDDNKFPNMLIGAELDTSEAVLNAVGDKIKAYADEWNIPMYESSTIIVTVTSYSAEHCGNKPLNEYDVQALLYYDKEKCSIIDSKTLSSPDKNFTKEYLSENEILNEQPQNNLQHKNNNYCL